MQLDNEILASFLPADSFGAKSPTRSSNLRRFIGMPTGNSGKMGARAGRGIGKKPKVESIGAKLQLTLAGT